jgi:hypothetical protein
MASKSEPLLERFDPRGSLDPVFTGFLYCATMLAARIRSVSLHSSLTLWIVSLLAVLLAACSSKTLQYPEDHERFRRIDQAVESLREAYQQKDRSRFESLMLPLDQLDELRRESEADFDLFHSIVLDFKTERIMIEGDDIDVYVHWQGIWKTNPEDAGLRQRGHARLQWIGTHSILLRGVQGDLPFGMKTRQTFSDNAAPQPKPR